MKIHGVNHSMAHQLSQVVTHDPSIRTTQMSRPSFSPALVATLHEVSFESAGLQTRIKSRFHLPAMACKPPAKIPPVTAPVMAATVAGVACRQVDFVGLKEEITAGSARDDIMLLDRGRATCFCCCRGTNASEMSKKRNKSQQICDPLIFLTFLGCNCRKRKNGPAEKLGRC